MNKKKFISDIENVTSYKILHNTMDVLGRKLSRINIIKKVNFITQKVKRNACWYLKTMKTCINLNFYSQIII